MYTLSAEEHLWGVSAVSYTVQARGAVMVEGECLQTEKQVIVGQTNFLVVGKRSQESRGDRCGRIKRYQFF